LKECNSPLPTAEDKFIVRQLKQDGLSYAAIQRATGFCYMTIKRWTDEEFAKRVTEHSIQYQRNRRATDPVFRAKQNQKCSKYIKFKSENCPAFREKQKQRAKERTRLIQDWRLSCILNGWEPLAEFRERVRGI